MLVETEQDPKNKTKSQEITDIKAYDARLGLGYRVQKEGKLATIGVNLKYCTDVQHM